MSRNFLSSLTIFAYKQSAGYRTKFLSIITLIWSNNLGSMKLRKVNREIMLALIG
jgi:hypothetical protein